MRIFSRDSAQIILNVKNFFKKELERGQGISLHDVILLVMNATKTSRAVVCKFSTQNDMDEYEQADDNRNWDMIVPDELFPAIRQVIRHLIVDMKTNSTLDRTIEILKSGTVTAWIPEMVTCKYSRASLHRFMTRNNFVFGPPTSHYEYTRKWPEIIELREKYLFG